MKTQNTTLTIPPFIKTEAHKRAQELGITLTDLILIGLVKQLHTEGRKPTKKSIGEYLRSLKKEL